MLNQLRLGLLAALLLAPVAHAQSSGDRYINPPGLVKPTGYTHVVVAADRQTVYVAGQVAFDSTGKVVVRVISRPRPIRCTATCARRWRAWADPLPI